MSLWAFGYRDQAERSCWRRADTTFGMSGGVQHNAASGLSVNGVYSAPMRRRAATSTGRALGAEVGWTGKIMDTGKTSLTVGYGKYERGPVEESTFYHLTVNQGVDAAAADVYASVAMPTAARVSTTTVRRVSAKAFSACSIGTRVKF